MKALWILVYNATLRSTTYIASELHLSFQQMALDMFKYSMASTCYTVYFMYMLAKMDLVVPEKPFKPTYKIQSTF